jgi:hypothetical protein
MYTRTLEIIKEVSRRYVVLKIPFPSMAVKDLTVESWTKKGNELHLLLSREVPAEVVPPTLIEKRINWEARYPGERSQ